MHAHRIEDVRKRISEVAVATPLLENEALNKRVGGRVLLKAESLQATGSFKFRAAYNRLAILNPDERRRGAVSYSSGNFGKGLAAAGRRLDVSVQIVVPHDAPSSKVAGIQAEGARVVRSEGRLENRETAAARLAEQVARETGATLLHPFEDEALLVAHAALICETMAEARDRGASLDVLVVPCGGGGLAAGCCMALEEEGSACEVFAVEPEGYDGMALSLAAGERRSCDSGRGSICDALQAAAPGLLAFDVVRGRLTGTATVSDAEVVEALRFAIDRLGLIVEPSAAAPLAALLGRKIDASNRTVGVILTGGNVDFARLESLLGGARGARSAASLLSIEDQHGATRRAP